MAKQLVVRLHRNGSVDAETLGMTGAECLDHIAALEDLLDAQTVQSSFTDAYRQSSVSADAQTGVEERAQ